ncbi:MULTISPECIES: tripartite tricarboxylate transporter substrate binding protein [unclassified Achromobacter]|uniref:tripartite tricarboxylate transporter substrate binding protein n=1 Tax=unclassified Achromobacter TaxID=2626865 RepID=UPI000B515EDF|nr:MULTISPECIES: tripartite tricarboxylate transporter substrate binding protein [unclassified Achromobacter]OWT75429.1 ABC transporter substrate-binding protein [Achromobacter sp. HZ28]OWT76089.1 ABC transporter substrate-binding protein [Achromobacter sp. HZ34]
MSVEPVRKGDAVNANADGSSDADGSSVTVRAPAPRRARNRLRAAGAFLVAAVGLSLGALRLGVAEPAGGPAAAAAAAAGFPKRPITILVTFPPGGGTDLLARRLGAELNRELGQNVIVENRPGASGNLGARAVAEAAPDGYTLLMVNSSYAINPGVYRNLPFSPKRDLRAVINVAFVPSVLVVPAASPLHTLGQALASAGRQDPAAPPASVPQLAYASCGNGTPQHLAGEMLRRSSGRALQHVPYRGCGPALTDVLSGQVGMGIVTASSAAPFLASGRLRALAVTSPQRSELMPDVPTVAEQGFPGYTLDQWHGLLAPAGTPTAVIARLNTAVADIMRREDVQHDLRQLGFSPTRSSPQVFQTLIDNDIDRFSTLTASMNLHAD